MYVITDPFSYERTELHVNLIVPICKDSERIPEDQEVTDARKP